MTSHLTLFLVIAFGITNVHCMDCTFGTSKNVIERFVKSCPGFGDSSKEYCCLNLSDQSFYCCDVQTWALETGLGIIVPAIIAVVVVITLFVLCISCLCCSCCPWYRRRRRGTIYAHTARENAHQVPRHNPPPINNVNNAHPPYTAIQSVSPPTFQNQPPPYTVEPYAKQAPYNPNYQH